jgi:serine/threonine protein kinase
MESDDAQDDNQPERPAGASSASPRLPALKKHSQNALPVGAQLGEFEIIGLIGEGGFGIVYLARDHLLERNVAVKEYMPALIASRATDTTVVVRAEHHSETFGKGCRSFVNEARLLARFDHPALVKVYRFWEANGTAYMAMPYYDGRTLREVMKTKSHEEPLDEAWIRKILSPVINALEIIHRENCFHRDVAPDNIMLLSDGSPVLLDFGAARQLVGGITQPLTVVLKTGFAPVEQYSDVSGMRQGAWTDVYALAAVIHFMILGKTPPSAFDRFLVEDSFQPLAITAAGRFRDAFLRGVDCCLAIRVEDRPQSMAQMREVLGWSTDVHPASESRKAGMGRGGWRKWWVAIVALALAAVPGGQLSGNRDQLSGIGDQGASEPRREVATQPEQPPQPEPAPPQSQTARIPLPQGKPQSQPRPVISEKLKAEREYIQKLNRELDRLLDTTD